MTNTSMFEFWFEQIKYTKLKKFRIVFCSISPKLVEISYD